ncbi:MAG: hypothetical protein R2860_11625 [Desulfobacterales bacterium]
MCLYDDNHISIEGNTDITFTEDVTRRVSGIPLAGTGPSWYTATIRRDRGRHWRPASM